MPSQSRVAGLLRSLGLRPRKALGQHYLVSQAVVRRILEAAEPSPGDTVVEVGPGLGVLTREILPRVARLVAVELDPELVQALRRDLAGVGNLALVQADAREVDPRDLVGEAPYKVVANLPYYAASPIIRRFLEAGHRPTLMVVMVQREVAREMAAPPGRMGLLSVGVQFYGRPRIVATVPPQAFYPPPKVTSAVVRIDVYPRPALPVEPGEFFALVRAGFTAPRKQLHRSLAQGLGITPQEARGLLLRAGLEPSRRAESLSLEEWHRLYLAWREPPG